MRPVRLVRRVVTGFSWMALTALLVALQSGLACNTLRLPAAALQKAAHAAAWELAASTGLCRPLALPCALLIRSSTNASVECTLQCVIGVAGVSWRPRSNRPTRMKFAGRAAS